MNNPIPGPISAEVRGVETTSVIRSIALRQMGRLKELKGQQRDLKESMTNLMDNNKDLQDILAQAETMLQRIKDEKSKVKTGREYSQLNIKEKELRSEIKDIQESLNNHLVNYSRMTGSNFIEDEEGKEIEFKVRIKLQSGQLKLL